MQASEHRGATLEWLPAQWRPGLSLRRHASGEVTGRFFSAELSSVFQPIVDVQTGTQVGREAFVRCHTSDGLGLAPWNLFSLVADDDTLVGLDRLCRTLHVLNDSDGNSPDQPLFLNVHGRLLAAVAQDHGRAFRRVLDALGRSADSIVIEMPAAACRDLGLLACVLSNYRLNGFRVAANVASLDESRRLLRVFRPNFVKVDVGHLGEAAQAHEFAEHVLSNGAQVVFTRVGSSELSCHLAGLASVWAQGHSLGAPVSRRDGSVVASLPGSRVCWE